MKIHFISGLPRSGSTLLSALLRQNPRFHAGMSSPLAQIIVKMQQAVSRGSEGANFITETQRKQLLRGVFQNYYADPKHEVIFDTNRAWCAKMSLLTELFPDAKVICMVRHVPWILNSVEKLIQKNPLELSGIFGYQGTGTVFTRVAGLAAPDGMVGYAMNALREAYYGKFANHLMLVDYEALARRPKEVLYHIYKYLEEPEFEHDFENFEYEAEDFDTALGTPGLHSVKGPVKPKEDRCILPPELFEQFHKDSFWRNQELNYNQVPTLMFKLDKQVEHQ